MAYVYKMCIVSTSLNVIMYKVLGLSPTLRKKKAKDTLREH